MVVPLHQVNIDKPAFSPKSSLGRILQLYWYIATCDVCAKIGLAMYADNSQDEYSSGYVCQDCLNGMFAEAQKNVPPAP